MGLPDKIDSHADLALLRLPYQFDRVVIEGRDLANGMPGSRLKQLIELFADRIQILENVANDVLERFYIADATGAQLDDDGDIVGIKRASWVTDDDFRRYVYAAIQRNLSKGEPDRLLAIINLLTDSTIELLNEYFPASIVLNFDGTIPGIEGGFTEFMKTAKAAGVHLNLVQIAQPYPFVWRGMEDVGRGFSQLVPGSPIFSDDFVDLSAWINDPPPPWSIVADPEDPTNTVAASSTTLSGIYHVLDAQTGVVYMGGKFRHDGGGSWAVVTTPSTAYALGIIGAADGTMTSVYGWSGSWPAMAWREWRMHLDITNGIAKLYSRPIDGDWVSHGSTTLFTSASDPIIGFAVAGGGQVWIDEVWVSGELVSDESGGAFSRLVL